MILNLRVKEINSWQNTSLYQVILPFVLFSGCNKQTPQISIDALKIPFSDSHIAAVLKLIFARSSRCAQYDLDAWYPCYSLSRKNLKLHIF